MINEPIKITLHIGNNNVYLVLIFTPNNRIIDRYRVWTSGKWNGTGLYPTSELYYERIL